MISLGPFSMPVVAAALALLLAWLVARLAGRDRSLGRPAADLLVNAALLGLVVARLAYVAWWWPDYLAQPFSVLAIGDGGFYPWVGLAAAVLLVFWRTLKRRVLRSRIWAGMACGLLLWAGAQLALHGQQRRAPGLPVMTLTSLQGQAVDLQDLRGQTVVLNLWATWCPPCRRELPAFEQAQAEHPDAAFVFANQGEDAAAIRDYLAAQGLQLQTVVLDRQMELMALSGSRALPTTLFYDRSGKLQYAHLGELSAARIRDLLQQGRRRSAARQQE